MWKGRTFYINGYVTVDDRYLIGTNKKGQTQTVEDVLNSLAATARFTDINATETDDSKWMNSLDEKYKILSIDEVKEYYHSFPNCKIYTMSRDETKKLLDLSVDRETFDKQLKEAIENKFLFVKLRCQ